MGTKYEYMHFDVGSSGRVKFIKRFLHPKVQGELYDFLSLGNSYETEGSRFWRRYNDYADACLNPNNPIDCRYQKCESRLPNPYNKGLDWFPEAIEAIKADVTRFEDIEEWKIFWSPFHVFQSNKTIFDNFCHECILDQMSEGFKLLGL
jgi:hypothetical protein